MDCCCSDNGWWCRGCGRPFKIAALIQNGYSESDAKMICNFQKAGCDKAFVPCFICNKDGKRKCDAVGYSSNPMFWHNFELPQQQRKAKRQKTKNADIPTKKFCKSCDEGWWCEGCGSVSKREVLAHHGFAKNQIEDIYDYQSGKCSDELVPCFVCNREGEIPCREVNREVMSMFWNGYDLPDPIEE